MPLPFPSSFPPSSPLSSPQRHQRQHIDSPSLPPSAYVLPPLQHTSSLSHFSSDEASHLLEPSGAHDRATRLDRLLIQEDTFLSHKRTIRAFYSKQNQFVASLKQLVHLSVAGGEDEEEEPSTIAHLAIQISLAVTFVLLALKLFTAIYSGSIAVLASAIDSCLDVLSQGTLLFTSTLMQKPDVRNFPSGKHRMEPVAIVMFSLIMAMAGLFIFYISVIDLQSGLEGDGRNIHMDATTISIIFIVIGIQLVMWLWCRRISKMPVPGASAADALAQDHINDVTINIIGGVPAIIAGLVPGAWIADPIGGMVLSLYISSRWIRTCLEQLPSILGKTAPPAFLNQLTYLAGTHDERIHQVDTVIAYHVGLPYQCEVHIVLDGNLSLRESHDIGESLEQKIERLPNVARAFVHNDFEFSHAPEHQKKKKKRDDGSRVGSPVPAENETSRHE